MRELFITLVLLGLFGSSIGERKKRIGIFEVVKFTNDQCAGTGGKNGTCFTEDECESRNGAASGECAEGYGVCCVFSLECGGMRKENCTYFESTNGFTGPCVAQVCKLSSDIAQIRLDFDKFIIAGPTTSSVSTFKALAGAANVAGIESNQAGSCTQDQFAATSPGGHGSPVICGTNTGEHMYIDASEQCNTLSFNIASTGTVEWSIKVMQYSQDYINKAPSGCLQYYFGSTSGTVKSYNFDGADRHLNNQNQLICVRREANNCRICWSAAAGDFAVSGMSPTATATGKIGKSNDAGGYGADGKKSSFDHVRIPSPTKEADSAALVAGNSGFAGHALVSTTGGTGATICSKALPFRIRFASDGFEVATEAAVAEKGFKMAYAQATC